MVVERGKSAVPAAKYKGTALGVSRLQDLDGLPGQRHLMGQSIFRALARQTPDAALQVDLRPLHAANLAAPLPEQQQEADDRAELALVSVTPAPAVGAVAAQTARISTFAQHPLAGLELYRRLYA